MEELATLAAGCSCALLWQWSLHSRGSHQCRVSSRYNLQRPGRLTQVCLAVKLGGRSERDGSDATRTTAQTFHVKQKGCPSLRCSECRNITIASGTLAVLFFRSCVAQSMTTLAPAAETVAAWELPPRRGCWLGLAHAVLAASATTRARAGLQDNQKLGEALQSTSL